MVVYMDFLARKANKYMYWWNLEKADKIIY